MVSTAVVCVGIPIGIGALAALKRFVLQDTFGGFPVWTFRNDVHTSQIVEGVNAAALAEAARQFPAVSSYSPTIQSAPRASSQRAIRLTRRKPRSSPTLARCRRKSG